MYSSSGYLKPFTQIQFSNYKTNYFQRILNEINSKSKEHILGVNEEDYQKYLTKKYTLEELDIDLNSESYKTPSISGSNYNFEIMYNFTGSIELFSIKPNPYTMSSYQVNVDENNNKVSFELVMQEQNAKKFQLLKNKLFNRAFCNINHVNENIRKLNLIVPEFIVNTFHDRKKHFLKENDFFSEISQN